MDITDSLIIFLRQVVDKVSSLIAFPAVLRIRGVDFSVVVVVGGKGVACVKAQTTSFDILGIPFKKLIDLGLKES